MPDPLAHVYDLALRALAEQERQVSALHGRLAPVLAAGGLAATLLAPAAFRGGHPDSALWVLCVVAGLVGVGLVVLAAVYVLVPRQLTFTLEVGKAVGRLDQLASANEHDFYVSMTVELDEHRTDNEVVVRRLHAAITVMLCGMLVGMCGLAAAAAIA